jgi:hypothetical protein
MLNLIVINNNDAIRTTKLHFYKIFDFLSRMSDFKTIEFAEIDGITQTQMSDLFYKKYFVIPDNIIFFEHLTEIDKINVPDECKINIIIDDLHHQGVIKKNRIIGLKKVSRILSTYGYCFGKYYTTTVPIYFFPHSAAFDVTFNNNPINKILVSGRLNKNVYPFRNVIYKMSSKNKNIEYAPVNCNYEIRQDSENLIYGQRYVDKLNRYLICFTCDASSERPYIVAKHFEIMSSGSLLFAGNPNTKKYFDKLGFVDGVHYISVAPNNLEDKIKYVTDPINRDSIDIIRKNGYEFVRSRHFYRNRAQYLKNILIGGPHQKLKDLSPESNFILHEDGIFNSNYYLEKYNNNI